MAEIVTLAEAIAAAVHDGDTVAMEGFTHLIPHAAGHEVIRQRRRDLTLVRMTPDIIYDQLIGAGCARKLVFSWAGQPWRRIAAPVPRRGRALLARSRWRLEEHSHAGMANRYQAGASGLPFAILRGYRGTSLAAHTAGVAEIECPFTGEMLTAVSALRPDVAVIHAQRADRQGNVQYWGITGVQKEARAGRRPVGRHGRGDRRRAGAASRVRSCCQPGASGTWPSCPAARIRPTRSATPPGTTTSTWPGTRSAGTGSGSPPGWTSTSTAHAGPAPAMGRSELHPGRDDDRDRRSVAARRDDVLRRHRPAQRGGQPRTRDPRARPGPDLRVGHDRGQAQRRCRCPSGTGSWPRPPMRWSACRRSSTTGCSPAASTSASSARPSSTGTATSTRR